MSYNTFLDAWFGSMIFYYLTPLLLLVAAVFITNPLKDKKKKSNKTFVILCYSIPVLLLVIGSLNAVCFGYGTADGISDMKQANGHLYVFDYIYSSGSKGSRKSNCYRIHILNAVTGEKQTRFFVDNRPHFLMDRNDSLSISQSGAVTYYSNTTGKELAKYSEETLPVMFHELSTGINHFTINNNGIINVQTLDGNSWRINPTNKTIKPDDGKTETHIPTHKLYVDDDKIKLDDQEGGSTYIDMDSKDVNQHQEYIYKQKKLWLNDRYFLDGKPVAINEKNNCFFIMHYETIKKEQFILSCISLTEEKVLWEVKQKDLAPDYVYNDDRDVFVNCEDESDRIFVNVGTEIFALNITDGKILWKTGL